jgi:hypothetical protein
MLYAPKVEATGNNNSNNNVTEEHLKSGTFKINPGQRVII